ncbi:MAG: hypothetical protein J3K34DRAFT_440186 [Monoraphidium minutum]|nr:MAG: hypothetical protein J3K34DRAFT_440186 [Monoraphidium minutum]
MDSLQALCLASANPAPTPLAHPDPGLGPFALAHPWRSALTPHWACAPRLARPRQPARRRAAQRGALVFRPCTPFRPVPHSRSFTGGERAPVPRHTRTRAPPRATPCATRIPRSSTHIPTPIFISSIGYLNSPCLLSSPLISQLRAAYPPARTLPCRLQPSTTRPRIVRALHWPGPLQQGPLALLQPHTLQQPEAAPM